MPTAFFLQQLLNPLTASDGENNILGGQLMDRVDIYFILIGKMASQLS